MTVEDSAPDESEEVAIISTLTQHPVPPSDARSSPAVAAIPASSAVTPVVTAEEPRRGCQGGTCLPCRISKVRCDKTVPCGRCRRRNLNCVAQTVKERRRRTRGPPYLSSAPGSAHELTRQQVEQWHKNHHHQFSAALLSPGQRMPRHLPQHHAMQRVSSIAAHRDGGESILAQMRVGATAPPNALPQIVSQVRGMSPGLQQHTGLRTSPSLEMTQKQLSAAKIVWGHQQHQQHLLANDSGHLGSPATNYLAPSHDGDVPSDARIPGRSSYPESLPQPFSSNTAGHHNLSPQQQQHAKSSDLAAMFHQAQIHQHHQQQARLAQQQNNQHQQVLRSVPQNNYQAYFQHQAIVSQQQQQLQPKTSSLIGSAKSAKRVYSQQRQHKQQIQDPSSDVSPRFYGPYEPEPYQGGSSQTGSMSSIPIINGAPNHLLELHHPHLVEQRQQTGYDPKPQLGEPQNVLYEQQHFQQQHQHRPSTVPLVGSPRPEKADEQQDTSWIGIVHAMLNHADPFIKASAEKLLRQIIELGAETSMTKKPMSHSAMMGFGYPQQIDGESSSSEEENYPSASEENDDPPQELASPPMSPRVGSKRTASEREEKPSDALDEEKEAKKARADEAKSSADAPKEETKGSEAPAAESRQKSEDKASTNVEEPWDKIRTLANESEHLSPLQTLQYVTQMVLSDHKKHSDLTNLSNSAVNLTEEKHEKGATHSPPRSQETADS